MRIKKTLFLPVLTLAAFLAGGTLSQAQTAEPAASPAAAPTGDVKPSPSPAAKKARKKKKDEAAPAEKTTEVKDDSGKPLDAVAPGGGPGMVWVNTKGKVYHSPDSRYYGRTKNGKYMTEEEAKTMGARPAGSGGKKKEAKKE